MTHGPGYERSYEQFKAQLQRLAERHGTTAKVVASLLTDSDFDHDWRRLFDYIEVHDFFERIKSETTSL